MNAKRCTVYRTWTTVVELQDVASLAPNADLTELVERIGTLLARTFDHDMVGFTFDPEPERLLVTFKHQEEASGLAMSWDNVVDIAMREWKA